MTEWQPIETAPKDGTNILVALYFRDSGKYWGQDIVYWYPYINFWGSAGYDWVNDLKDDGCDVEVITHWMPLPAPPKMEDE